MEPVRLRSEAMSLDASFVQAAGNMSIGQHTITNILLMSLSLKCFDSAARQGRQGRHDDVRSRVETGKKGNVGP